MNESFLYLLCTIQLHHEEVAFVKSFLNEMRLIQHIPSEDVLSKQNATQYNIDTTQSQKSPVRSGLAGLLHNAMCCSNGGVWLHVVVLYCILFF